MITAGIYVHIPFCENICNYCDYYITEKREAEIPLFVEMLIREIELTDAEFHHNWQFDSIYLGGGSPALLPFRKLEIILNKLREYYSFFQFPEISLEINPGENSFDDLKLFKEMGITRNLGEEVESWTYNKLNEAERIATKINSKIKN